MEIMTIDRILISYPNKLFNSQIWNIELRSNHIKLLFDDKTELILPIDIKKHIKKE